MKTSAGESRDARAAASERWRRLQKLLTDPQTFTAVENGEFASKMKPAVQKLSTAIILKATSYIRAMSKVSRWQRAADAYGSVELLLAKDKALIKQFLSSYKVCQKWEIAGLQASLVHDLEGVLQIAEGYLVQIANSDLKALKNQLTAKVQETGPLLEKSKWKDEIGDSAPWKDVVDAGRCVASVYVFRFCCFFSPLLGH